MLTFSFSLLQNPADDKQVVLTDTTVDYGVGTNPARADVALVAAAELLSPWQPEALEPEMGLGGYDPILFVAAGGGPLILTRPQDGVLRVIVAVVPLVTPAAALLLPVDTAYCLLTTSQAYTRGTGLVSDDPLLEPRAILGEGIGSVLPLVTAYAVQYFLWTNGMQDSLARLNLRYLQLPYAQQQPLLNLYERAQLIYDGTDYLFNLRRFLDAAAVLEGGRQMLLTDGQTPDAYAPLLVGYLPSIGL